MPRQQQTRSDLTGHRRRTRDNAAKAVTGLPLGADDVAEFDAAWRSRWPQVRPIGHEMRSSAESTFTRFHSLPESKRYASTDAEYDEILRRHETLISELSALTGTSTDDLRSITASWSGSPAPIDRDEALAVAVPEATHWQSIPYDVSIPEEPVWTHLYLGATTMVADDLRNLLLLVADDETAGVIICPPNAAWLYHPYDGGGDVIAPNRDAVETLRARHVDWLPANDRGL